jgi:hypothetical protein
MRERPGRYLIKGAVTAALALSGCTSVQKPVHTEVDVFACASAPDGSCGVDDPAIGDAGVYIRLPDGQQIIERTDASGAARFEGELFPQSERFVFVETPMSVRLPDGTVRMICANEQNFTDTVYEDGSRRIHVDALYGDCEPEPQVGNDL